MKVQHRKYTFIHCTHSSVARYWRFCLRIPLNISTTVLLLYMFFFRGKRISGVKLRNTKEVGQNKLP